MCVSLILQREEIYLSRFPIRRRLKVMTGIKLAKKKKKESEKIVGNLDACTTGIFNESLSFKFGNFDLNFRGDHLIVHAKT